MRPLKKILIISSLPVFMLVLSGCGSSSSSSTTPTTSNSNTPVSDATAPGAPAAATNQQQQTPDDVAAIAAQKQSQLPALPADSKQAIDTEINSINSDIAATNNTTSSTDLSNANLGL
jgi:hypothetical protein